MESKFAKLRKICSDFVKLHKNRSTNSNDNVKNNKNERTQEI